MHGKQVKWLNKLVKTYLYLTKVAKHDKPKRCVRLKAQMWLKPSFYKSVRKNLGQKENQANFTD